MHDRGGENESVRRRSALLRHAAPIYRGADVADNTRKDNQDSGEPSSPNSHSYTNRI